MSEHATINIINCPEEALQGGDMKAQQLPQQYPAPPITGYVPWTSTIGGTIRFMMPIVVIMVVLGVVFGGIKGIVKAKK